MSGTAQRWQTNNDLTEHIRLIRGQIQKSIDDPATRVLAAAIVSGNFDDAVDPRTGQHVPVVSYHGRFYRGASSWEDARQICGMRDYACEVTSIWNFIVLNLRYTQDQDGEDTYSTLRASLEQGAADCDDMVVAFAALLKAVGFSDIVARVVSVQGATWDHIYCLVMLPNGQWLALDATEKGHHPGWEFQRVAARRDFAL